MDFDILAAKLGCFEWGVRAQNFFKKSFCIFASPQINNMRKKAILFLILCFGFSAVQAKQNLVKRTDSVVKTIFTTYYAKKFEGRKTTSGERYRGAKFTAAHLTLPFGTMVTVRNLVSGKVVTVKVNDRGPHSKKFSLDLSQSAAKALGIYRLGYAKVEITYILSK
jgi:rare lipoprotein A